MAGSLRQSDMLSARLRARATHAMENVRRISHEAAAAESALAAPPPMVHLAHITKTVAIRFAFSGSRGAQ